MKLHHYALYFIIALLSGSAVAESKSLNHLALSILNTTQAGDINVRLVNSSNEPLRLWTETNIWGAYRWRVIVLREGKVKIFFEDPDGIVFTKNVPTWQEIKGDSFFDMKLQLSGEDWYRPNHVKPDLRAGDQLIVIYDVPPSPEAHKMSVWYGIVAASSTIQ